MKFRGHDPELENEFGSCPHLLCHVPRIEEKARDLRGPGLWCVGHCAARGRGCTYLFIIWLGMASICWMSMSLLS